MMKPLVPPRRKNPLKRTRLPVPPPEGRSRQAHLLTRAAAEGGFGLPACLDCGALHYPPRDACPECLSGRIGLTACSPLGTLAAATVVTASNSVYFRERSPWRTGLVVLDAGPGVVAHVHGDCLEGGRTRLEWRLDRGGNAVAFAVPDTPTPHMMDDPQMRETTLDPRHRRVLVTDGRTALGRAVAKALSDAGAATVFVGVADPWKPFPGQDALAAVRGVSIVPLDLTSSDSVTELADSIGARTDILINTAEHVRPGGLLDRKGVAVAREELEVGYLGLVRLAQAFGPVMRFRGADGDNSACAWVNVFSVYAHMAWPAYGAWSASQAALLAASLSLRGELRAGGVRVVHLFTGPTDDEWFQPLPPPKVTADQIARAAVDALQRGLEDVYVGDVAQDLRARLELNPKALERELGS
ncbi:MAG: SDR family NAD(P)-dependent oxidoreductase [Burkholderiales bacterium]|nr:SDR family NAD(P)-dependent oxidoreductase [Burkholderiales bacterium]